MLQDVHLILTIATLLIVASVTLPGQNVPHPEHLKLVHGKSFVMVNGLGPLRFIIDNVQRVRFQISRR